MVHLEKTACTNVLATLLNRRRSPKCKKKVQIVQIVVFFLDFSCEERYCRLVASVYRSSQFAVLLHGHDRMRIYAIDRKMTTKIKDKVLLLSSSNTGASVDQT